mgnify:CR=1 FL=1
MYGERAALRVCHCNQVSPTCCQHAQNMSDIIHGGYVTSTQPSNSTACPAQKVRFSPVALYITFDICLQKAHLLSRSSNAVDTVMLVHAEVQCSCYRTCMNSSVSSLPSFLMTITTLGLSRHTSRCCCVLGCAKQKRPVPVEKTGNAHCC